MRYSRGGENSCVLVNPACSVIQWDRMSEAEVRNIGLAFAVVFLVAGLYTEGKVLLAVSVLFFVAAVAAPHILQPFCVMWQTFTNIVGDMFLTLVISVIFVLVITPIGVVRRIVTGNQLFFRRNTESKENAFYSRVHKLTAADLRYPY